MKFAVSTLGCKVNSFESESYVTQLKQLGFEEIPFQEVADIYIINTCAVTNTASSKSRQRIHQAKRNNPDAVICVVGCYVQVESEKLQEEGIDILIGSSQKSELGKIIVEALNGKKAVEVKDIDSILEFELLEVPRFQHQTRAYLKVQDGCNQFCSYCIIPHARGRERSLNTNEVIQQAKNLVLAGHPELILAGIHTGRYLSKDQINLAELIELILTEVPELQRIRISSIEVNEISDHLIKLIKENKVVANHLHIPIQSGTDKILKLMNRTYSTTDFKEKIKQIREAVPMISISTDVIVGFPSETEEDFNQTKELLRELKFSFLHVFPYSSRKNTPAASMKEQLSKEVKKKRVNQLLNLSNELSLEYRKCFLNKSVSVIVEQKVNGYYRGYSDEYFEVHIKSDIDLLHQVVFVTIYEVTDTVCLGRIEG